MSEFKKFIESVVTHVHSSSPKVGICYTEVTAQYIYPDGVAGVFVGTVAVPVKYTEKSADSWLIPVAGVLRLGLGTHEATVKANLTFVLKANDKQSFCRLATFDREIKHTAQELTVGVGSIITGACKYSSEAGSGVLNIAFTKIVKPWGV